jgi:choice-of-anchor A domain-containing protein
MNTKPIASAILATVLSAVSALSLQAGQTVAQAVGTFDNLVGDYNLITLGNAVIRSYGDTEGMIAIGGNLTIDGGLIAAKASFANGANYSNPALYVNGTFTSKGLVSVKNGYAALPHASSSATWDSTTRRLTSSGTDIYTGINSASSKAALDPRSAALDPHWNFATLGSQFLSLSSVFAGASISGQISVVGQTLKLAPISSGQHGAIVFSLDMDLISGNQYKGQTFTNVQFDVANGCEYIVNVLNADGRTLFGSFGGINFNQDSNSHYDRLLWNIVDKKGTTAETVTFGNGGQFYGSVLAPTYLVKNGENTPINGQVVAGSLDYNSTGSAELHYTGFDGDIPETPEASTYGLFGGVICFGLVLLRRQFRR